MFKLLGPLEIALTVKSGQVILYLRAPLQYSDE